jgi:hypothetical protein
MDTTQEKMKAEIRPNNKFEVLQSTLVSQMDAHHIKTEATHKDLTAAMEASHERFNPLMDVSQEAMETYPEMM